MNGHDKRRQNKMNAIIQSAITLFNKYGVKKVSIEEIAAEASTSKVTIYKYFSNKENLCNEIVKIFLENSLISIESVVSSNSNFLDKLKFIISIKSSSSSELDGHFIEEVIKNNAEVKEYMNNVYNVRINNLMSTFFDQGKEQGYINNEMPNNILFIYTEIFKEGLKAKSDTLNDILVHKESFEQLINLYFFGLIQNNK